MAGPVERQAIGRFQEGNAFLPNLPIKGHEDFDLVAELGQKAGQRASHIGQAACLGVGSHLRGKKRNFHWALF